MDRKVSRHELKYIISRGEAELLRHRLPALLHPDRHAGPNGAYFIRSVYFDDPDFTAFNENISGVKERTKYRLRYYNFDDRVIFLEKKTKDGSLTGKDSVRVDREMAQHILNGGDALHGHSGLLGEFARLRLGVLRPVVTVDYDRNAFTWKDGNVRVTIDANIRTSPYQIDFFSRELCSVPVMDNGEVVLEIKYDEFLPAGVIALLEGVPKQRSAVSKFTRCLGILE